MFRRITIPQSHRPHVHLVVALLAVLAAIAVLLLVAETAGGR
jgi:hypothetical protein